VTEIWQLGSDNPDLTQIQEGKALL